jgi:hypothetical protein
MNALPKTQPPRKKRIEEGGPIVVCLSKDFADKLGHVPEKTPLTYAMFFRVLMWLAEIRSVNAQAPVTPTLRALE